MAARCTSGRAWLLREPLRGLAQLSDGSADSAGRTHAKAFRDLTSVPIQIGPSRRSAAGCRLALPCAPSDYCNAALTTQPAGARDALCSALLDPAAHNGRLTGERTRIRCATQCA